MKLKITLLTYLGHRGIKDNALYYIYFNFITTFKHHIINCFFTLLTLKFNSISPCLYSEHNFTNTSINSIKSMQQAYSIKLNEFKAPPPPPPTKQTNKKTQPYPKAPI